MSLVLSWVFAMTLTPLNCISLLKAPAGGDTQADPYAGGFFRFYRRALEGAIRYRLLTIGGFVVNLAEAVLIVLMVLTLAMGWRMGLVIGWALIVTILGTFIVMKGMDISLQRGKYSAGPCRWKNSTGHMRKDRV